ncbi:SNF2-related protein [Tessaracoccus sp.]
MARRRTTRATPRKRAAVSARPGVRRTTTVASTPVPGPGERLWVLAIPFEERGVGAANGARWDRVLKQTIFVGRELPFGLAPYVSAPYSWERWQEDELTGSVQPVSRSPFRMTPRKHQIVAAQKIAAAAAKGYRGFVEADDVGLGKTISVLGGVLLTGRARKAKTVLIVCPKGVIQHWRNTIAAVGDGGMRFVVTNYDQAAKLLTTPDMSLTKSGAPRARKASKKETNRATANQGEPTVAWDIVIADESHKLKNASLRRAIISKVFRYQQTAAQAPFVVWMSATVGQDPTELGYLAPLLAQLTGAKRSALADYGQWLSDQGFCVEFNKRFDTWDWAKIPEDASPDVRAQIMNLREQDLRRVHAILFAGQDAPAIRRLPSDIAGWPEVQRIPYPTELDVIGRARYMAAWTTFRTEMNLAARGKNPAGGMAARMRFRQKASLLRVPSTVEQVLELLDNGLQVAVSVEFHETSDAIRAGLLAAKVACAEYSGRNTDVRESERLAFQHGHRKVMLFSVLEGISLHAGESLADGSTGSQAGRATIVHDPRYSGLDSIQIEGRCHRDGQAANVYYSFAAGTVEEGIVQVLFSRIVSTKQMAGDDVSTVKAVEAVLAGAPASGFLPPAMLGAGLAGTAPAAPSVPVGAGVGALVGRAGGLAAGLSGGATTVPVRKVETVAQRAAFKGALRGRE